MAARIVSLKSNGVFSILDYSKEGTGSEEEFDFVAEETLANIQHANDNEHISYCVFKPSGIGAINLYEKVSTNEKLSEEEEKAFQKVKSRYQRIAQAASDKKVRVLIDAEESWIQPAVDKIVEQLMKQYNHSECIVYQTVQLYRKDRLQYLRGLIGKARNQSWFLGVKLVRGAYLEKERERAQIQGYESPICETKEQTDKNFDEAIVSCVENIDVVRLCSGTHNQKSVQLLVDLMMEKGLSVKDSRIDFAQLLGMSDNLSFNLSHAGFLVSKYVPYGPIEDMIPYLGRRAEENSSVKGQTTRELELLTQELERRKGHINAIH